MSKQIAKQETQGQMIALIEKVALDPNSDVDKMSKLLDVQERLFDKNAQIAFSKAMVDCQNDMPLVTATAVNPQTNSTYVKYEHLMAQIKPVYTKHGFGLSFGEEICSKKDNITVSCDVVHIDGFSKKYEATLPIDSCGIKGTINKTGIHATASAYTYAKRYLTTMIFNIAIADHDDDAVKAGGITVEQLLEHNASIRQHILTIAAIKDGIYNNDLSGSTEAWHELTNEEKTSLWRAPTKGGIFTTEERKIMRSDEWNAAGKAFFEEHK